jgi:hypothetical protein
MFSLPFRLLWCRVFSNGALALFVVSCYWPGTVFAEEQVIKLGGIRNVTATILKSDETYRITVEMLPVKAFDPATNERLNLAKAQAYAARALAKQLGAGRSIGLIIHGLEIRENGNSGERFRMVAVIPRKGVTVAEAQTSPAKDDTAEPARQPSPSSEPTKQPLQTASSQHVIRVPADATTDDFLNRKAEYLETIAQLRETLTDDGKAMETSPLSPDDFYDAVGNLEERSNADFRSLGKLIDGDKLLVSIEQDELHLALKTAHAATLESLKAAVARFDGRQEKTKKQKE